MEQTHIKEQSEPHKSIRPRERIGTPMHEIYENILKQRKFRLPDGYDEDDYNDDDADCYCE